uniref:Uncharacterized protein n=1 Tax=Rhizophora mucronata TaxID=61149 RepID=A0A2P2LFL7_RHIMU
MFSRSISTKNLSFVSQRRRLIPYEPILIPFRALFSTHMVGDRPMLVGHFYSMLLFSCFASQILVFNSSFGFLVLVFFSQLGRSGISFILLCTMPNMATSLNYRGRLEFLREALGSISSKVPVLIRYFPHSSTICFP